jgi:ADP-ribosylglycohydrolase
VSAADRARGALYGLAIGDALGMPTQLLSQQEITARWGPLLTGFEPAPPGHPIAAGLPPGAVTDDTEQAVLLARMLVKNRGVPSPDDWAAALIAWELDMAERGSLDLLGPSTKRALTAVLAGTPPEEAGRHGDTNGAAMRITPVGIAFAAPAPPADEGRPSARSVSSPHASEPDEDEARLSARLAGGPYAGAADADASGHDACGRRAEGHLSPRPAGDLHAGASEAGTCRQPDDGIGRAADDVGQAAGGLSGLVDHVVEASLVTHNTSVALAGAAAVAAAVSAGIAGASVAEAVNAGIAAARLASGRGHWVAGADVAARIRWAVELAGDAPPDRAAELIGTLVGTSLATQESVPAAFAVLSAIPHDPWRACLLAASLGGDTDTIAAMAGAIAGACHGQSAFPPHAIATIDAHGFALPALADALLTLRKS